MGDIVKDELDFYSKFTKPLIFNLPDPKDRVIASAWVKKIRDETTGTEKLRTDYMKLLLFALQRRRLVGVFADDPTNYEQLEEFPPEVDLNDIAKRLIEKEQFDRQDRIMKQMAGQIGDFPPYTTDCSSDFREYVAAQDIPGFGVHCYYAVSREPVNKWQKADKGIFPKMAKSAVDTTTPTPPGLISATSDSACACPPKEGETESECKKRRDTRSSEKPKKKPRKKLGKTPPIAPLGTVPLPEDRTPPTWGSNLVEVRDMPQGVGEDDVEEEPELDTFGPLEGLSEVSMFMEEFKKEAISKTSPKKPIKPAKSPSHKRSPSKETGKKPQKKESPTKPATSRSLRIADDTFEDVDADLDLDQSRREESIREDSHLMDYLKDRMNVSRTQKQMTAEVQEEIPARAGIPITTPRRSPSPKRPRSSERLVRDDAVEPTLPPPKPPSPKPPSPASDGSGEIDVDAIDDEELAEMGITREEAKRLFATDIFKLPGEEEFDEELDVSEPSAVGSSPEEDAEWLEWDLKMKALEEEAERELQELRDAGLDVDYQPPSDEAAQPDYQYEMPQPQSRPPTPQKFEPQQLDLYPQTAEQFPEQPPAEVVPQAPEPPPKEPSPKTKTRKGKPGIPKPAQAKPGQAKPDETKADRTKRAAKPSQIKPPGSKTKLPPPGAKGAKKPPAGAKPTSSRSKIPPPGSKLKPPSTSKVEAPKAVAPPEAPIMRGSPQASPVLSQFQRMKKIREQVASVMEEAEPEYPAGVDRTPPVFSKHEKVRKAAEGLVYAPEDFGVQEGEIEWQHAPDFFKDQAEFIPFDPRQQGEVEEIFPALDDRICGAEMFFDMEGEPAIFDEGQLIDEMDIPPSPLSDSAQKFKELELYSMLEDAIAEGPCVPCSAYVSPPPAPAVSQRIKTPPPLPTWEHQLPQNVLVSDLPPLPKPSPPRMPPRKAPPKPATPPSVLRDGYTPPPRPKTPTCAAAAYSPGSAKREHFTPPLPQRMPSPARQLQPSPQENVYTCEPLSPELESILQDVTPDRILTAQGAGSPEAILERTPPENIFGIAGLAQIDASPPIWDDIAASMGIEESSPCGPCGRPAPPEVSPIEHLGKAVGYSVAEMEPKELEALSPKFLDYKSPKKKLTRAGRKQLKKQEEEYVDYLFADDKDTHDMVKRALEIVADIEQEEADPYHLMPQVPPSPPSPYAEAFEDSALLSESLPSYEQVTPPPSPTKAAGPPMGSKLPQPGRAAGGIPRIGIPKPGAARPPSKAIPQKTGIPPPGAKPTRPPSAKRTGLKPPSKIAAPGTARQPSAGIPAPGRPGIAAPCRSGIPAPGTSRIPPPGRSGIPAPGRSGIPAPGRSGIPAPGGYQLNIPQFKPMKQPSQQRAATSGGPCQMPCSSGIARPTAAASKSGIARPTQTRPPMPVRPKTPTAEDMRMAEFVHRVPDRGPPAPAYLPQQPPSFGDYPPMRPGFKEAIQRHQIDQVFFEPYRPLMQSRNVVTGKTGLRRQKIERISSAQMPPTRPPVQLASDLHRRHYDISEAPEETPLSPKTYGVPGIQVPPRPVCQPAPTAWAPIPLPPDMIPPKPAARPASRLPAPGSKLRPPGSKLPAPGTQVRRPPSGLPAPRKPSPQPPAKSAEGPCPCAAETQLSAQTRSGLKPPSGIKPPTSGKAPQRQIRPPGAAKPPVTSPRPDKEPCPCSEEYDMEELSKYGLTEEDLRPIDVNLDVSDVSDVSEEVEGEIESVPDAVDDSFERWEAHMRQLEEEHAEDIALYGHLPAFQPEEWGEGAQLDEAPYPCAGTSAEPAPQVVPQKKSGPSRPPSRLKQPSKIKPPPSVSAGKVPSPVAGPSQIRPPSAKGRPPSQASQLKPPSKVRPPGAVRSAASQPTSAGKSPCACSGEEGDSFEKWEASMKNLDWTGASAGGMAMPGGIPDFNLDELGSLLQQFEEGRAALDSPVKVSVAEPMEGPAQISPAGRQEAPRRSPTEQQVWVPPVPMIPFDKLDEAIALLKQYEDMEPENLEFFLGADYSGGPKIPVHQIPTAERLIQKHGRMAPDDLLFMLDEEELVGVQTSKGFKPHGARKVQYPQQVPPPCPSPPISPWWESDTPSPPCLPPPKPTSPLGGEYAGFFRSPKPGPSRVQRPEQMIYSPPAYDSPGGGALEESPPRLPTGQGWQELQIPGARQITPSPPKQQPPCQPCEPAYDATPKKTRKHRRKRPQRRLDFEYVGQKETDIADEYIEGVLEQYDEILPPLPPGSVSPCRSPTRTPPRLPGWKTPEEVEKMVPRQRTPSPKPQYVMPEVKPHEYFMHPPTAPADLEQSVLVETPPPLGPSPPPCSPRSRRRASPRRQVSPLPEVFGQTPPLPSPRGVCIPCTPPGISPGNVGVVEDIFTGAGVSPAKLPPPSPPSPYSTEEAMQQMVTSVRGAEGREGIVRMPMIFDKWKDFKPMRPIREVTTQPGIGSMGLPGVVQMDWQTLGTGQLAEEPYVRSPYVPPSKRPSPVKTVSPRRHVEAVQPDVYSGMTSPISAEELQAVAPTSPLPQFRQADVTPPRPSPTLPKAPVCGAMIEQTSPSFAEIETYDKMPTPVRAPQVTPKPSPMLTPGVSPRRTPPCGPILSPQLPMQGINEAFLMDESGQRSMPASPEYYQSPVQRPPSRPVSPQYMAPQWTPEQAPESSIEQEEDEMGLPSLVQLYAQHMPPVYASPTEKRQRRIITWHDEGSHLAATRPACGVCTGGDIQMDALPVPQEQVQVDIPIAPLEPFVPKSPVPAPYYNLSPPLPQYQGAGLQEQVEFDPYACEEASVPSVGGTPSPQRQPSPRTPSPRMARSPPRTKQRWGQLLDETRRSDQFDTTPVYAPSPEQISPCGPCGAGSPRATRQMPPQFSPRSGSPAVRSPMTVRSPASRSPVQQMARPPSPQAARLPSPQILARSPQPTRPPTPVRAPSPQQRSRSPVERTRAATPVRAQSPPIEMPELSPFRMPQPSPPCMPCGPGSAASVSRESPGKKVVKQTMTQRKIVTVIPPPPSVPLEFEGEVVEPFGGSDKSGSDMEEEDTDFKWMD